METVYAGVFAVFQQTIYTAIDAVSQQCLNEIKIIHDTRCQQINDGNFLVK